MSDLHAIPQDDMAEQGFLGAVLLGAMDDAIKARVSEQSFNDLRCQKVWKACLELTEKGLEVNPLNVASHAGKDLLFFINDLPEKAPTASNLPHWTPRLKAMEARRKAFHMSYGVLGMVSSDAPTEDILERLEKDYFKLSNERTNVQSDQDHWDEYEVDLLTAYPNGKGNLGQRTGYHSLDRIIRGYRPASVNVIGARPGQGKTALALQLAYAFAKQGKPVCFFSYEMPFSQLADRLLAIHLGIDMTYLHETGKGDWKAVAEAVKFLRTLPLFVEDKADCGVAELRSTARRYQKDKGVNLFFIDYLQLIPPRKGRRESNRTTEVSELSREIKLLGQETKAAIFLLSQLNREVEHREGGKPRMSDLRESGAVEQDADTVTLLYDPPKEEGETNDHLGVMVSKNRHHGKGSTVLRWDKSCNRFFDLTATGMTDEL